MAATVNDLSFIHDHDFIGVHDGGQSMSNDDRRSFPHDLCERLLHMPLALRIECTGGLVELPKAGHLERQDRCGNPRGGLR